MGFLEDYFINPVLHGTGYNPVNTLVYAVLLVASLPLVARLMKRLGMRADERTWASLLPFVVLGGLLRAMQDHGMFSFLGGAEYALFVTPGIYLTVFLLALASILLEKKVGIPTAWEGIFLLAFFGSWYAFVIRRITPLAWVLGVAVLAFIPAYFVLSRYSWRTLPRVSSMPVLAHVLDASASWTAISVVGGYFEQHVLPSALFSPGTFWMFIPLKLVVAALAVLLVDKYSDGYDAWVLKFALLVLGLGPGVRDTLTMLA